MEGFIVVMNLENGKGYWTGKRWEFEEPGLKFTKIFKTEAGAMRAVERLGLNREYNLSVEKSV